MIRGIIFDCFGVLYQGSSSHLYELTPETNRAEFKNLSLSSDYGYISHEDFTQQASELIGKPAAEIEQIMQRDHIRNEAMLTHVRLLRSTYKVALLSNVGRGVMGRLFSQSELDELFDEVVLSSDVGMTKPDPEIFIYTAEKLGLPPEECMMVDDIAENIAAANDVGMEGVVFNTTDKFLSDARQALFLDRQ
jgi:HAD superfamily hydrolase (TIGR01509 family)